MREDIATAGIDVPPAEASGPRRRTTAPATVLVADDDPFARSAIHQILEELGYGVVEAANGTEALELLSRAADEGGTMPDVVLLDFVMPGFSGLGILRVMRRFESPPPTIVMTGFSDPTVETFASHLGAVCVLRKPLEEEELRAAILTAASSGRGSAPR